MHQELYAVSDLIILLPKKTSTVGFSFCFFVNVDFVVVVVFARSITNIELHYSNS